MINFASQLGKTLGGIYGSKVIIHGRKQAFITFNILTILDTLLMQWLNVWAIILGKFLQGISVTVVHLAVMKIINETVPLSMVGYFGVFIQLCGSIGMLLCLGLGIMMPPADYDPSILNDPQNQEAYEADKEDNYWRLINFVPVISCVVMLFNFCVFIKTEPIMFSIRNNNLEDAKVMIKKIYHPSEDLN